MTIADSYQLSNLIVVAAVVAGHVVCILLGFWMGRKTVTDAPLIQTVPDPGPTDEPEDDYFTSEIPEYGVDTDQRISTV